jgi:hypothetical protein
MIVLFSAGGRTGNQLFQISHALSARHDGEWVVTFEMGETRSLLSRTCKRHWLNIESRRLRRFFEFLYPVIHHALVNTRIVSYLHDRENLYTFRKGRIRCLTIMKGYFESSPQHREDLATFFRVNESIRSRVRHALADKVSGHTAIFIHMRRSDFVLYDRMLPDSYYLQAAGIFQKRISDPYFVIVGDDPSHAENLFRDIAPRYVSHLSPAEDLALMSLCEGGVLSNSTLSWWGAFFGSGTQGYVAPKYWFGFKTKTWHPPEIKASFMTDFVEIE